MARGHNQYLGDGKDDSASSAKLSNNSIDMNDEKFKNGRAVARVKHVENLKTFTGYIQLKTSSFPLSDYSLQWIKNGK